MKHRQHIKFAACLCLPVLLAVNSLAATYDVGTLTDLNTRIGSAVAGDLIVVSNGVYTNNSTINITRVGTAAKSASAMATIVITTAII